MRWDETSPVHRPERVSPWKIEPALTHAPDHLPVSQMKRPRASISSSTNSSQHATEGMARITCGEILFPCGKFYSQRCFGLLLVVIQTAKWLKFCDQVRLKSL